MFHAGQFCHACLSLVSEEQLMGTVFLAALGNVDFSKRKPARAQRGILQHISDSYHDWCVDSIGPGW